MAKHENNLRSASRENIQYRTKKIVMDSEPRLSIRKRKKYGKYFKLFRKLDFSWTTCGYDGVIVLNIKGELYKI